MARTFGLGQIAEIKEHFKEAIEYLLKVKDSPFARKQSAILRSVRTAVWATPKMPI